MGSFPFDREAAHSFLPNGQGCSKVSQLFHGQLFTLPLLLPIESSPRYDPLGDLLSLHLLLTLAHHLSIGLGHHCVRSHDRGDFAERRLPCLSPEDLVPLHGHGEVEIKQSEELDLRLYLQCLIGKGLIGCTLQGEHPKAVPAEAIDLDLGKLSSLTAHLLTD
ncbi:hypothetical protein HMPREF2890_04985 [Porphyromonas sp. HMSC065F10]|nr:hypothetical protein HMPREF2890_04985 [Porphyromonas sp. HMSC065F10]